jgi:hypothetical protein
MKKTLTFALIASGFSLSGLAFAEGRELLKFFQTISW